MCLFDYAVSRHNQSFFLCVPKSEQPISDAVVEGPELPDVGIFQLLEELLVFLSASDSPSVIQDFLLRLFGYVLKELLGILL